MNVEEKVDLIESRVWSAYEKRYGKLPIVSVNTNAYVKKEYRDLFGSIFVALDLDFEKCFVAGGALVGMLNDRLEDFLGSGRDIDIFYYEEKDALKDYERLTKNKSVRELNNEDNGSFSSDNEDAVKTKNAVTFRILYEYKGSTYQLCIQLIMCRFGESIPDLFFQFDSVHCMMGYDLNTESFMAMKSSLFCADRKILFPSPLIHGMEAYRYLKFIEKGYSTEMMSNQ